jgi:hypothetical protein
MQNAHRPGRLLKSSGKQRSGVDQLRLHCAKLDDVTHFSVVLGLRLGHPGESALSGSLSRQLVLRKDSQVLFHNVLAFPVPLVDMDFWQPDTLVSGGTDRASAANYETVRRGCRFFCLSVVEYPLHEQSAD